MTINEIIKAIIEKSPSWSQNKLGAALGISQASMSNRMNVRKMGVPFAVEALGLLGYDLVVVPKGSNLPRGSVIVERGDEG